MPEKLFDIKGMQKTLSEMDLIENHNKQSKNELYKSCEIINMAANALLNQEYDKFTELVKSSNSKRPMILYIMHQFEQDYDAYKNCN